MTEEIHESFVLLNTIKGMADILGAESVDPWDLLKDSEPFNAENGDELFRELTAAEIECRCLMWGIVNVLEAKPRMLDSLFWRNFGMPVLSTLTDAVFGLCSTEMAAKRPLPLYTGIRRKGDKLVWVFRSPTQEELFQQQLVNQMHQMSTPGGSGCSCGQCGGKPDPDPNPPRNLH
jgi:hypothetical protein